MKQLILVAVATLAIALAGCNSVRGPDGWSITSFGMAKGSVDFGTITVTTTGYTCGGWIDADGAPQPCRHIESSGGGFTGWETIGTVLNAVSLGLRF